MKESKLIKDIRNYLKSEYPNSVRITKYHGNQYSETGVSDLLICFNGKFVALETKKSKNEKKRTSQDNYLREINNAGGYAFYICNIEQVKIIFNLLFIEKNITLKLLKKSCKDYNYICSYLNVKRIEI